MALNAANDQSLKEAAKGLYDLYRALQDAGFDKTEADDTDDFTDKE
jgi:hypothetical protein